MILCCFFSNILVGQPISNASTKWKQDGITVAGGGADKLDNPYDLAFDSKNQSFFVADHENARIQRYSIHNGDNRAGVTALKLDDGTA